MRATRLGPALRAFWKVHRLVLRASGGRVGSTVGGMKVLLLETTGRTSGQPRSVSLFYLEEDGRYYVVGSYSGEDRDPAWVKNVRAQPKVSVTIGGRSFPALGRSLEGTERDAMFERFRQADDSYAVYQERTQRRIPVIELRPDGE